MNERAERLQEAIQALESNRQVLPYSSVNKTKSKEWRDRLKQMLLELPQHTLDDVNTEIAFAYEDCALCANCGYPLRKSRCNQELRDSYCQSCCDCEHNGFTRTHP